MNKKTTYGLLTLAVLGVGAYFLLRKRKKISKFRQRLVDNAKKELDIWDGYVEMDAEVQDRWSKYWEDCCGDAFTDTEYNDPAIHDQYPWSAAFVSSVVKDSGAGDTFNYNQSHASYLVYAIENRKNYLDEPFKAYRTDEVEPEVGDIVCKNRGGGNAAYDEESAQEGEHAVQIGDILHCDIITYVGWWEVDAIGGNLSNTVKEVSFDLDSEGKLTDEHFAIIKTDL